jgi:hypothetical protein
MPVIRLSTQVAAEREAFHDLDMTGRQNKAIVRGIPFVGQLPYRGVAMRMGPREQIK